MYQNDAQNVTRCKKAIKKLIVDILFWNINKKDLTNEISEIANQHKIDIIILCEYNLDDSYTTAQINQGESIYKISNCFGCTKIKIFTSLSLSKISIISESDRWTIRKIQHNLFRPFLLVAAHLPSKNYFSDNDQTLEAINFRDSIDKAKMESGIDRVVIIGDLNMNPFEDGLLSTKALHATPDRNIALRVKRKVQGKEYEYFYNPMWNFLGDEIFDQLLISPNMIKYISNKKIQILTKAKTFSLLKNGQINKTKYSDHLPLIFNIFPDRLKMK